MKNSLNLEEFKKRASKIHNNFYNYDISKYDGYHEKIKITCPKHGSFEQRVKHHLNGNGCRKCAYEVISEKNSPWNDEQQKILIDNFDKISLSKISKLVGFSKHTVEKRAKLSNLKKDRQFHHTIPNYIWTNIRNGAKKRGFVFDITIDYIWKIFIKQRKKCALTGCNLIFSRKRNKTTASIDRIDSKKGYIKDNVQIIHKDINKLKMDFSEEKLFDMCSKIVKNLKNKNISRKIVNWEVDILNNTEYPVHD